MKSECKGQNLDQVAEEELWDGPGHSGGDEHILADPGEHGEAPHELPAGVKDQKDSHPGILVKQYEESKDWSDGVHDRIEPFLASCPIT